MVMSEIIINGLETMRICQYSCKLRYVVGSNYEQDLHGHIIYHLSPLNSLVNPHIIGNRVVSQLPGDDSRQLHIWFNGSFHCWLMNLMLQGVDTVSSGGINCM